MKKIITLFLFVLIVFAGCTINVQGLPSQEPDVSQRAEAPASRWSGRAYKGPRR
jgi:hypothetical protein